MPQEYFYNGHLRWTLFWENPNCWAAFLACLVAWVWVAQAFLLPVKKSQPFVSDENVRATLKAAGIGVGTGRSARAAFIVLCIVEAGIWFLLVKTYSRGGLVAAVAGMVFFFGLSGTGSLPVGSHGMGILPMRFGWHGRLARVLGNLAIRIALIAVLCVAVGFASRMSPDYIAQDKSVLNRFDQWKAALVMISDSPFHGWGYKLSGMAYQNWYQPLSHTTRPIGFVNSYLEVAVEQGSHVLFFAIVCACALLLIAVRFRRAGWVVAAGASLVAWLVGNLWSSIWGWGGLWILPSAAALCIMGAAGFRNSKSQINSKFQITNYKRRGFTSLSGCKPSIQILAISLAVGIVVWVGIVGAGRVFAKDFPFQARPVARGDAAIVSRRGERVETRELRSEIWVDAAVTGRYWGKTIRTILEDKDCGRFIVYAPWALRSNRLERPVGRRVYFGFQAELFAGEPSGPEPVIVLHPTIYPPSQNSVNGQLSKITVCLPEVDVSAYNFPWRLWAAGNGTKLLFSPQGTAKIDPEQNKEFWRSLLFQ